MTLVRRRQPDGSLGPLEKVFPQETEQEKLNRLEKENELLKARNNALSERADFIEDIIAEMAMQVYQ